MCVSMICDVAANPDSAGRIAPPVVYRKPRRWICGAIRGLSRVGEGTVKLKNTHMVSSVTIAVYLASGSLFSLAQPRNDVLQALTGQFHTLVDRVNPAVVQIIADTYVQQGEAQSAGVRTQRGTGSGVIVDPTGFIVTNAH